MPWTTATTRASGYTVTAAVWNAEHVDNMNYLQEVAYVAQNTDVTTSATTVGTAVQIVSAGAVTYEAVPHLIEFYCADFGFAANSCNVILRDSTTVLGTIVHTGASDANQPLYGMVRLTPTAASHTYNIAAWLSGAGTATFNSGTGGAAGTGTEDYPIFIRITRVPT